MAEHGPGCPSCRAPMLQRTFGRKLGGDLELDICFSCRGIWFDGRESIQMSPQGIVDLFGLIHAHRSEARIPLADVMRCPRCEEALVPMQDLVRHGRFNYLRCAEHGRFTVFAQFLIEKGFIRQVSKAEVARLRADVAQLRCSSCGAPLDLRTQSACGHCRAPIVVLDAEAVNKALADYLARPLPREIATTVRERTPKSAPSAQAGPLDLVLGGLELAWEFARS